MFAKVVPGISETLGAYLDDDRCSRCASLEQVMRELNRPQRGCQSRFGTVGIGGKKIALEFWYRFGLGEDE